MSDLKNFLTYQFAYRAENDVFDTSFHLKFIFSEGVKFEDAIDNDGGLSQFYIGLCHKKGNRAYYYNGRDLKIRSFSYEHNENCIDLINPNDENFRGET